MKNFKECLHFNQQYLGFKASMEATGGYRSRSFSKNSSILADANLTRVNHHVTGVLSHGHKNAFVYTWTDKFGSTATSSSILKVLEDVAEGSSLPPTLYLQADNSSKDNKNFILMGFLANLVQRKIFRKGLMAESYHPTPQVRHLDALWPFKSTTYKTLDVTSLASAFQRNPDPLGPISKKGKKAFDAMVGTSRSERMGGSCAKPTLICGRDTWRLSVTCHTPQSCRHPSLGHSCPTLKKSRHQQHWKVSSSMFPPSPDNQMSEL
ncbi:uncharacterized protein LOC134234233 [Saccostrea cucullata]|uniref:uncharacterized protein LOC134234233 n=1 Tax=Saccostrea cuccullata TaxID=36930 RepID=UPI002ED61B08